ncbi:hypothetical protein [Curtobacterium sp. Csp2]|uniref:hypothetical protein n=1 Tax=Curtobacterium sp. Csp2 TaxID=2495430 RepID=UPI001C2ED319|nr:hypothetical protein [Curtobacterium sp. Csp2]
MSFRSTPEGRLSAGSDSYGGTYVAFNAFDQNLIIGGAMSAIGDGGGIRCGTKALRVCPVSHRAPRCA